MTWNFKSVVFVTENERESVKSTKKSYVRPVMWKILGVFIGESLKKGKERSEVVKD